MMSLYLNANIVRYLVVFKIVLNILSKHYKKKYINTFNCNKMLYKNIKITFNVSTVVGTLYNTL